MEILRIVLITLLVTVALGSIIGVILGKRAVRRALSQSKPLLSFKERIVYASLLVGGAACIVVGIFLIPGPDTGMIDGEIVGEEFAGGELAKGNMDQAARGGEVMVMGEAEDGAGQDNGDAGEDTVGETGEEAVADDQGNLNEDQNQAGEDAGIMADDDEDPDVQEADTDAQASGETKTASQSTTAAGGTGGGKRVAARG